METIGWIGSILLAFCGLPQAIKCFRTKSSAGIDPGFIMMWLAGELFTLAYVLPKLDWPLLFNYGANILFIGVIVYYKVKPGNK